MKFPNYIKYLVDAEKYRLVALAMKSGVHASDLSKILNLNRPCGLKMAVRIITGLNEDHQAQALVSWLSDQIPGQLQHLVHIVRSESSVVREDAPDIRTVEGSLAILEKQAESNEALRTVLMNLAKAFTVQKSA
jgi:hypothetical protein